jgi:hypothetical protein
MAKKRITLEHAEGLMALGTAREARQDEEENGAAPEEEPRRHPRKSRMRFKYRPIFTGTCTGG